MAEHEALDPRRHAYRDDLAAKTLLGRVRSARFVEGRCKQVGVCRLPVRRAPQRDAPRDTEALFGECVTVFDEAEGWAWVQLARDGYVGYVAASCLRDESDRATHRVVSVLTLVYREPSALSSPLMHLPFNAMVGIVGARGGFVELSSGGFVGAQHLADIDTRLPDYVDSALQFIGLPYLFGGKTGLGLDCSGLVQLVLQAAGHQAPRDSDMQSEEISPKVDIGPDLVGLQRGDLVFWPGHVGIMVDAAMVVHANATTMSVALEPVCDVDQRSRKDGVAIASVSRPDITTSDSLSD